MSFSRIEVEPAPLPGNAAISLRYPIDSARWLWHPKDGGGQIRVLRFVLVFELTENEKLVFDATADQRFILSCDGREIGRGPDRAELGGWSFHRYEATLDPGEHRLEALVWWLGEEVRPLAQVSARPAFALVGLDAADPLLSTGVASWKVSLVGVYKPLETDKRHGYHVIGSGFEIDGGVSDGPLVEPVEVARGGLSKTGVPMTPWRCEPSPLPEQDRPLFFGGRLRGDFAKADEGLCRGQPVTVPAQTEKVFWWDLEDYVCGYARLILEGGKSAVVEIEWAESLYEEREPRSRALKGHRGEFKGKSWLGFGDRILHPGGKKLYEPLWWRSGRWLRLTVRTGEEDLCILDARPRRTGFPFSRRWAFSCDQDLSAILALCENGLRNSVHETFVDCPYYEQMQYLGDVRVQSLVWLAASGDPRPVKRALELFDRSRWFNGFHAERCPTDAIQMSSTYSLVFPPLLRDFVYWCDEPDFVRRLLPGMRSALEQALAEVDQDGVLHGLPGWLFVDWVHREGWDGGVPVAGGEGLGSPIALHLPVALEAAAQVEDAYGDPLMAGRWRRDAQLVLSMILEQFGNGGLLSDDQDGQYWSEHAQALALACQGLPDGARPALVKALANPPENLASASIYFSYHVHEALLVAGEEEAFWDRMAFWKKLPEQGFLTTAEEWEPTRSDCHGWGSHPLYHFLTAVAGVRPSAPGFKEICVTPRPGPLAYLQAKVPHPKGQIEVSFEWNQGRLRGTVHTPVPGRLVWENTILSLREGENLVEV